MAITHSSASRGFALLIAVIFMAVMLSFGLTLSSLAYKQVVLSSAAIESQYAFYAADSALECALYADRHGNYAYPQPPYSPSSPPPAYPSAPLRLNCRPRANVYSETNTLTASQFVVSTRIYYDTVHCADVTVYKPNGFGTTYIFSQGYDVKCSLVGSPDVRFVSRGLSAAYATNN